MKTPLSLTIEGINRLTPSAVSLSFNKPNDDFAFQAGQYLNLEAEISGSKVRRSYSLCSAPHESKLSVGIKKIEGGVFSTFANDDLKVGDKLTVFPPEGRFVINHTSDKETFLAFAAGSGITPIFSMIKSALSTHESSIFHLVYGNKTPEEVMFKDDLISLENRYPNRFKIHWVYSKSNEENSLFGRIDDAIVSFALNKMESLPSQVFICGPEAMIHLVKDTLVNKNMTESNIHFELFTASTTEKENLNQTENKVKLTIKSDEEVYEITSKSNKTLLDSALQQKIEVPYSCQGGVCCSCIAKVTEGSAKMESNQVLTDEEIEEGLVLTCQAYPTSSSVTFDYDDV
jgi:ring-1,2-phenylacetyl-CoA epoxidase subunit PaaE